MHCYQKQRFELKYRIPSILEGPIRDFVSGYLDPDPHSAQQADLAYPVHSLYLDSRDLKLFQSTVNGDRNRYKLRVRYYERNGTSPLFFEIKARRDSVICKQRAMVRRAALPELLGGRPPTRDDLVEREDVQLTALMQFCAFRRALGAVPQTHVGYHREAWLTVDNSVRVTMDRRVRTGPDFEASLDTELEGLTLVFGNQTVLEIKFTDRFPRWLSALVQHFNLRQGSAAKYVDGVVALGEHRFLNVRERCEVRRRLALRAQG
jgi:hypothetical protein